MSNRRTFTPEFKAQVVLELVSGAKTSAELCRLHQLSPSLLAGWQEAFVTRAAAIFQAEEHRSADAARVAELERLVGRQALDLEILKKASSLLPASRGNR